VVVHHAPLAPAEVHRALLVAEVVMCRALLVVVHRAPLAPAEVHHALLVVVVVVVVVVMHRAPLVAEVVVRGEDILTIIKMKGWIVVIPVSVILAHCLRQWQRIGQLRQQSEPFSVCYRIPEYIDTHLVPII